jgi:hypothetical protein
MAENVLDWLLGRTEKQKELAPAKRSRPYDSDDVDEFDQILFADWLHNPHSDSHVLAFRYDLADKTIEVEFAGYKDAPSQYGTYYDVEKDVALLFYRADSWGKFVWWRLRTNYSYAPGLKRM